MQIKSTTIYIVRHGQTEGNIRQIFGLAPELSLTDHGKQQVKKLSKKLSLIHFDYMFSSDLLRAKQTAEILAKGRKIPIATSEALRERSYGRLNGKTAKEIKRELKDVYDQYLKMSNQDKFYFKLVEDMETVDEVVLRFTSVLREIAKAHRGKTILIVSHVTPMRGLLVDLGHVDYNEIDSSCIENTAHIKLESDGINFFVKETSGIQKKS